MAENSKIEWTTHTFNPWRGCTKVSEGCANCYADTMSKRNPKTLGIWGPNGTRVVASEAMWKEPLKWDKAAGENFKSWERAAMAMRSEYDFIEPYERPRVFCASLADVFEDWGGQVVAPQGHTLRIDPRGTISNAGFRDATLDDVRRRLFALIDATPNLDWLLLTKRPENIAKMMPEWQTDPTGLTNLNWPRPNVWLGTSVENQQTADERIPHLLRVPAKVRFLSVEPLLGAVDINPWLWDAKGDCKPFRTPGIDWVIVGGESGHGARPMHPDWVRSIRDQCQAAGVPFFFKQWGEWCPDADVFSPTGHGTSVATRLHLPKRIELQTLDGTKLACVGKKAAGRMLDGREWSEFPEASEV